MKAFKSTPRIFVVIFLLLNYVEGGFILDKLSRFPMADIMSSSKDIAKGVVKQTSNLVPTSDDVGNFVKQKIAGLPFELLSFAINEICGAALASDTIEPQITPDISEMKFQLRTPCENYDFPILEAEKLLKSPAFDLTKKVTIYASGWTTNVNSSGSQLLGQAYLCRGDTNFIVVDAAHFVDTVYSWAALNTEEIGKIIAVGLEKISKQIPPENIHLIGHSLGAHIVGSAGRYFNEMTGKTIRRITGLDPARPCFKEGERLQGLMRGDAEFIDIIHTNSHVLGKRDPVGDADFYPGGLDPLQPGCLDISCSHGRAVEYYAESVYPENEYNFMGKRCSSLGGLRDGTCVGDEFPMGYAVPFNLKGTYFLEVGSKSPFGDRSEEQKYAKFKECGVCKEN